MKIVLSCLLMSMYVGLYSQGIEKGVSALQTKEGYILIYNFDDCKFTLEIKSDKMVYEDGQYNFDINKRSLQITSEKISNVPLLNTCTSLMDSLIIHRNHILKVFENTVNLQFEMPNREMLRLETGDFLFWYFNDPEKMNSELGKHYYLTSIIGNRFLILKTSSGKNVNVNVIKDYLTKFALTLQKYSDDEIIEDAVKDKGVK